MAAPAFDYQQKYAEIYDSMQDITRTFEKEKTKLENQLKAERALSAGGSELAKLREAIDLFEQDFEDHQRIEAERDQLKDQLAALRRETDQDADEGSVSAENARLRLQIVDLENSFAKAREQEVAKVAAISRGEPAQQGADGGGAAELAAARAETDQLKAELAACKAANEQLRAQQLRQGARAADAIDASPRSRDSGNWLCRDGPISPPRRVLAELERCASAGAAAAAAESVEGKAHTDTEHMSQLSSLRAELEGLQGELEKERAAAEAARSEVARLHAEAAALRSTPDGSAAPAEAAQLREAVRRAEAAEAEAAELRSAAVRAEEAKAEAAQLRDAAKRAEEAKAEIAKQAEAALAEVAAVRAAAKAAEEAHAAEVKRLQASAALAALETEPKIELAVSAPTTADTEDSGNARGEAAESGQVSRLQGELRDLDQTCQKIAEISEKQRVKISKLKESNGRMRAALTAAEQEKAAALAEASRQRQLRLEQHGVLLGIGRGRGGATPSASRPRAAPAGRRSSDLDSDDDDSDKEDESETTEDQSDPTAGSESSDFQRRRRKGRAGQRAGKAKPTPKPAAASHRRDAKRAHEEPPGFAAPRRRGVKEPRRASPSAELPKPKQAQREAPPRKGKKTQMSLLSDSESDDI